MHFMCTIGIKPEPVKNVVGFVNVSEVFILFSFCRTKSCILHFSAKVSLEFPWNPAHFPGTLILQSGA